MTTRSGYHRHYHTEQLLIAARRKVIQECCQFHQLELKLGFFRHGGKDYATVARGGTELEIAIGSGSWIGWGSSSPRSAVFDGTKESFQRILNVVFPGENMRGT